MTFTLQQNEAYNIRSHTAKAQLFGFHDGSMRTFSNGENDFLAQELARAEFFPIVEIQNLQN